MRTDLELYLEVESILIGFFFASCTLEAVARFDWPLSVCLLGANLLSFGKIPLTRRVIIQLGVLHESPL